MQYGPMCSHAIMVIYFIQYWQTGNDKIVSCKDTIPKGMNRKDTAGIDRVRGGEGLK